PRRPVVPQACDVERANVLVAERGLCAEDTKSHYRPPRCLIGLATIPVSPLRGDLSLRWRACPGRCPSKGRVGSILADHRAAVTADVCGSSQYVSKTWRTRACKHAGR